MSWMSKKKSMVALSRNKVACKVITQPTCGVVWMIFFKFFFRKHILPLFLKSISATKYKIMERKTDLKTSHEMLSGDDVVRTELPLHQILDYNHQYHK